MSRVSDVLRFGDRGLSVEDARKKMIEAGEAPSGKPGVGILAADELEPEVIDTGEVVVAKNPNAAAQAIEAVKVDPPVPVVLAPVVEEKTERVENERFVAEIRQEKGKWIAEIQYKSGSGTERFVTASKNELLLKLLEGKGHATLRVKEAVRREKLGGPKLDKMYQLPEGVTSEEFEKMSDAQQKLVIDTIAAGNALQFREDHPEYYRTAANGAALDRFLREHDLPYTVLNLEYAFEDMTENDLFPDKRPGVVAPPAPTNLTQTTVAPRAEDSVSVAPPVAPASPVATPAAQPAATLRKRGSTGLPGGHSSAPSNAGAERAEDTGQPRELSETELKKLPLPELKRIADTERRRLAQSR